MVGSRGRNARDRRPAARALLGLFDTWAFFTSRSSSGQEPPPEPPAGPPTGGTEPFGSAAWLQPRPAGALAGALAAGAQEPAADRAGAQRAHMDGRQHRARRQARGRYSYTVSAPGVYRVRYHAAIRTEPRRPGHRDVLLSSTDSPPSSRPMAFTTPTAFASPNSNNSSAARPTSWRS